MKFFCCCCQASSKFYYSSLLSPSPSPPADVIIPPDRRLQPLARPLHLGQHPGRFLGGHALHLADRPPRGRPGRGQACGRARARSRRCHARRLGRLARLLRRPQDAGRGGQGPGEERGGRGRGRGEGPLQAGELTVGSRGRGEGKRGRGLKRGESARIGWASLVRAAPAAHLPVRRQPAPSHETGRPPPFSHHLPRPRHRRPPPPGPGSAGRPGRRLSGSAGRACAAGARRRGGRGRRLAGRRERTRAGGGHLAGRGGAWRARGVCVACGDGEWGAFREQFQGV